MKLTLDAQDKNIVIDIISRYPYTFYAYGSRATGKAKQFSDLDLCIKENVDIRVIGDIQEAFDTSNITIKVDLTSWDRLDPSFQSLITNDLILLEKKEIKD